LPVLSRSTTVSSPFYYFPRENLFEVAALHFGADDLELVTLGKAYSEIVQERLRAEPHLNGGGLTSTPRVNRNEPPAGVPGRKQPSFKCGPPSALHARGWKTAGSAPMKNRFTMSRTGEMDVQWCRFRGQKGNSG
jgi:hypothetical protein